MPVGVMWRVRIDDGSEYGPVDEGKLLSWAREGRITPNSQISSDGTTWVLAPRKPELEMEWLVETSSGEHFGPFHHDVVQRLLDSKKITSETRLFRLSGKSEPALKLEIGKLQTDYERVKSEKEDAAKRVQSLSAELEKARVALEANGKREAELGELLSASACREASLAEEARSLKNAMDRASARVKELSEELESARAEVVKERKTCDELRGALGKIEKSGKKTGFGNLFQGRSLRDLSLLELAAQREFARRKRGRGPSGYNRPNTDAIDV